METLTSGGTEDQTILTSLEWTDEELVALKEAIIGDGRFLLPAGVNKHFNMIAINRKFQMATKKKVDSKVIWDRLNDYYDIPKLDNIIACPFPNEQSEFTLPESDFSQLIRDRKSQSSQDKMLDDESRDSGSGRETPPTLPIAKRGAALQSTLATSSNKRKYSSSFSDAGSESGTGRKSNSNTPTGSGSSKAKRRI